MHTHMSRMHRTHNVTCTQNAQLQERIKRSGGASSKSEKALANPQLGKATQVLTAIMQLHKQVILEITSKRTPQKSQINAIGANFLQSQKRSYPTSSHPQLREGTSL